MTINFTTLFTRLGLGFSAQKAINTARGTTIPPLIKDFIDDFATENLEFIRASRAAQSADTAFQGGASQAISAIKTSLEQTLIETVKADVSLPRHDLTSSLAELISQMVAESETVDASSIGVSASTATGNGNGVIVATAKRADGLVQENAFDETIEVECASSTSFLVKGEGAIASALSHEWPRGSGATRNLSVISATGTGNLLSNGGFDTDSTNTGYPDDWVISTGTLGSTIKLTSREVQQIVISGSPSAGHYYIRWSDADSKTHTTVPIAYNATGSTVQNAIRGLPGLESATVTTTGTSPNFTHVITFVGMAGNVSQVTVVNNTTGGTFTVSTTTAGTNHAFVDRALEFDSNGSELTTIYQEVFLEPLKQYAFNAWFRADVVPAAGVIEISLVDGVAGVGAGVINDEQGTANSFNFACSALSNSEHRSRTGVFRTPRIMPASVYLCIKVTTAISSGSSVFADHAALAEMTELYSGGISAAIFSGSKPFLPGATQVDPDKFTVTVTNDLAGEFQSWFERNFSMRSKGLILPSNGSGSETIDDALIT